MIRKVMTLRENDRVEDRTFFSGEGTIAFISGNEIHVRFDDGSEEVVTEECFKPHSDRHWLI